MTAIDLLLTVTMTVKERNEERKLNHGNYSHLSFLVTRLLKTTIVPIREVKDVNPKWNFKLCGIVHAPSKDDINYNS